MQLKLFYVLSVSIMITNAQSNCGTIMYPPSTLNISNARMQDPISNWADFVPNSNTIEKIIRINFHYLLKNDGTGNFTETTDGNGNSSYNGYKYIEDLLPSINSNIKDKGIFNIQTGSMSNNLPTRINIIIEGIYFHRNSTLYNFYNSTENVVLSNSVSSTYNVNTLTSINVYLLESGNRGVGSGVAWQDTRIKSFHNFGSWNSYKRQIAHPEEWWYLDLNAKTFLHELGHCLSLWHVPNPSCGSDDFCDDTPTNICAAQWSCNSSVTNCSTYLMSYNNGNALSPCQLGRMHWTLENEISENRLCIFQNQSLNVTNLGWPQILYQARNLRVGNPNGTSTVLPNGSKAVFVGQNSVEFLPGFEAQLGSKFEIKIEPGCN